MIVAADMDRAVLVLSAVALAFPALGLRWAHVAENQSPQAPALSPAAAEPEPFSRVPPSGAPAPAAVQSFPPPAEPRRAAPAKRPHSLHSLAQIAGDLGPDADEQRCPAYMERLRQARASAPAGDDVWREATVLLASCHWATGNEAAAESLLHEAIDVDPLHAQWREHLAAYFRHQGRYAEAIALLQAALNIEERLVTHRLLATVHQRYAASEDLHQRDHYDHLRSSEEHLLRASELGETQDAELLLDIARTRFRRGEHLDAAYLYERTLITVGNDSVELAAQLMREGAEAWLRAEQPAMAQAYLEQARLLAPGDATRHEPGS